MSREENIRYHYKIFREYALEKIRNFVKIIPVVIVGLVSYPFVIIMFIFWGTILLISVLIEEAEERLKK